MRKDKLNRALQTYSGFKGSVTVSHIMSTIPCDLQNKITGNQLGAVMDVRNNAYQEGKTAAIREIEQFIGLPAGVSLWDVIGDKSYLGYKTFSDNLDIPEILEKRGQSVKNWKNEESK